ncbi:MFS transporter [Acetobacter sp.]|jgi:MHS family proline/betaine transporter-like MFS transporter|uniref:MFS transporter n=1 Tax=Acetobacter sp. TaxID=440 RepID=UPI0025B840F4|nr:MFS transporter [Acetobacter sp.]MCH4091590.1 MFS transporter [Acetobacter sp.]MCI1301154.1 MFS transporter [Acetobacter sp.]MCI1317442.1 MFS transporter [Acetobacter sp.]
MTSATMSQHVTVDVRQLSAVIVGCVIGTFIEWFDYACYGYLAAIFSRVFFPFSDENSGLLASYAVFGLAFLLRPVGGVLWGHLGDRMGRRLALTLSITLMSIATTLIAILPGYASIGFWAPLFLFILRLTQGFSCAGEYSGAAVVLMENAPRGRRGLFTALVPASEACGLLAGAALVALLTSHLTDNQMLMWGWRVPFLFALPLGLVSLVFRKKLYEKTEENYKNIKKDMPIKILFDDYKPKMLIGFGFAVLNAVGFYTILSFMPVFITYSGVIGLNLASKFQIVLLLFYIPTVFFVGVLADKFGPVILLSISAILFSILSIPLFYVIGIGKSEIILFIELIFGAILALNDGALALFLSEIFPKNVRYSGFSLIFNSANAIFGGISPFVMTWLATRMGSSTASGLWVAASGVAALCAVYTYRKCINK